MPVPEGLAGMRVDAGLSRLLGLSRTAAAALAEDGGVELDGVRAGKSDRLSAGAWLASSMMLWTSSRKHVMSPYCGRQNTSRHCDATITIASGDAPSTLET